MCVKLYDALRHDRSQPHRPHARAALLRGRVHVGAHPVDRAEPRCGCHGRAGAKQPGYLGVESAREEVGITVSYWRDLDSVAAWKRVVDHVAAQRVGRERWYAMYRVRIARVEREYGFMARNGAPGEA